jgi:hypothetical protein
MKNRKIFRNARQQKHGGFYESGCIETPHRGPPKGQGFFGGYSFRPLEEITGGYEDARAYESGRGSDEDEIGRIL